jgi:hypothetical protein
MSSGVAPGGAIYSSDLPSVLGEVDRLGAGAAVYVERKPRSERRGSFDGRGQHAWEVILIPGRDAESVEKSVAQAHAANLLIGVRRSLCAGASGGRASVGWMAMAAVATGLHSKDARERRNAIANDRQRGRGETDNKSRSGSRKRIGDTAESGIL